MISHKSARFWRSGSLLKHSRPFLKKHCIECHGPEKQEGDYRFDLLKNDHSDLPTVSWQGILDQLNLGEMPPKKQAQPSWGESAKVIATLTPALQKAYASQKSTSRKAVIRRLNKFELRKTLRDLFHLNHPDFETNGINTLTIDGTALQLASVNHNGQTHASVCYWRAPVL